MRQILQFKVAHVIFMIIMNTEITLIHSDVTIDISLVDGIGNIDIDHFLRNICQYLFKVNILLNCVPIISNL